MFHRILRAAMAAIAVGACSSSPDDPQPGTESDASEQATVSAGNAACRSFRDCEDGAACSFGRCIVDPYVCDELELMCEDPRPDCPQGETPSIVDGCWGECVSLASCLAFGDSGDPASDCEVCARNDWLCVRGNTLSSDMHYYRCVKRDPSCDPTECLCTPDPCAPLVCAVSASSIQDLMDCCDVVHANAGAGGGGPGADGGTVQGGRDPD